MAPEAAATGETADDDAVSSLKKRLFSGICISWFAAVVAHTLNLQSEAILIRNACGGDLGRAARLTSQCNAAAGLLGLVVNQTGAKLSDSIGRKAFFALGPLAQALAAALAFTNPTSVATLATSKVMRGIFTTFSGTVMGMAAMRDVFAGTELAVKSSTASAVIGLAIMVGPIIEGSMLKRMKAGNEQFAYVALAALGIVSLISNSLTIPETLPEEKRKPFSPSAALASVNPFGFLQLYTKGSSAVQRIVTISTLQTMIDGKNMSDLSLIWMREHVKLSVEGIRNFLTGFGFLSLLAGGKLTPTLLKSLSVWRFTTFTNLTNLFAFCLRASYEKAAVWFGALPFMLPGVNGSSTMALNSVLNEHLVASGFGVGESSAWLNNLRVLTGVAATLIYGYFYAFCRKRGIWAGHTYTLAGLLGAALPQVLLMLTVKPVDLKLDEPKSADNK